MNSQGFIPGGSADLAVDVELSISAKNLPDKDTFSKSDPICVVFLQQYDKNWVEYCRTEGIRNNLNPEFATKIVMQYRFEEQQKMKFVIYDLDNETPNLDDDDLLGEVECSLGTIVSSANFTAPLLFKSSQNAGQLIIRSEEIGNLKDEVELLFSGHDFKKSKFFSKPDPFLEIYKETGQQNQLIYRSSHIDDDCNPRWPKFFLPLRVLKTKDGLDLNLLIQCWNYNRSTSHKLIGEVRVTTREILESPQTFTLKDKEHPDKSRGQLKLEQSVVRKTYSFLDFISAGGTQLSCTIAIDFTGSNGHPSSPNSLHYYTSSSPTLYERAMQAVGSIIQDYDSDKQFPVLGFGAKIPPHGQLSHEFFVNLTSNPFCAGVEGVINAYRHCLPAIELYGPTNFAPVINHVANGFASNHTNGDHYFILLILTDGAITDMNLTKQAIIAASHLPLSIIIVGIGDADFDSMNELDSDNGLLSYLDKRAVRDIVQFVPFRDFLHNPDPRKSADELARSLLAEIPNQLVSFMKSRNIKPKSCN